MDDCPEGVLVAGVVVAGVALVLVLVVPDPDPDPDGIMSAN